MTKTQPYMNSFMFRLGKDLEGEEVWLDLIEAPHVLMAGMTGSGKSSLMNAILIQLYQYHSTHDVQVVLIDPKRVELAPYAGMDHTWKKRAFYEPKEAVAALEWVNKDMDRRFKEWRGHGRDIDEINTKLMYTVSDTADLWPRIVVVIDEMANLLLDRKHGKRVEELLVRIASMGRAAGIHLLLATQRPSADVITGLIRANVPTRFCLPVLTAMDSRIVLDQTGAEELAKPGDVLARMPKARELSRFKSEYITSGELDARVQEVVARDGLGPIPERVVA